MEPSAQAGNRVPVVPARRRNAGATREKLLKAGISEFCRHGYSGARTARIAKRANCNIRMLYHYFGSKEALYLAALERVYGKIREREGALDLMRLDPVAGVTALVEFTFDHMASHDDFVKLVVVENIQRGRHLKRSKAVPQATLPLVEAIADLLRRGADSGQFRKGIDPVQLYVSILSLSFTHLSNRYTLSITYRQDLGDPAWLAERRGHVRDMVLAYVRS